MMIEKYKSDIEKLVRVGRQLQLSMYVDHYPDKIAGPALSEKDKQELPNFYQKYQAWYSEAAACIAQLLPDRLSDFVDYYKPSRTRKELNNGNYTISDYLKGLSISHPLHDSEIVGPKAAIPVFSQQLMIVESLQKRFESSLFDIRTIVHADLLDGELDAAEELNKKGFARGAGAIAGVVLESHMRTVCAQHKIKLPKSATLGRINDALKNANVIELATWRYIQHLIDVRNLCDHKLKTEPSRQQISDLIDGCRKMAKTIF